MHSLASAFRSWTRRLDRSRWRLKLGRAGAVAIVTAVCLPALVMIMGFVADFAYASYINQTLARATDNATVGSVSQTAATAAGGYGDTAYMQNYGVNIFNANVSRLPFTGINFNLAVASDGTGGVTATGTYNFNVPDLLRPDAGYQHDPSQRNGSDVGPAHWSMSITTSWSTPHNRWASLRPLPT